MDNYQDRVAELDGLEFSPGITREQIRRIDKWRVARHEAAHVVAAAVHDSVLLEADLTPEGIDDNYIWERDTWRGQARTSRLGHCELSAVVAVAGNVGEHLYEDPDIDGYQLCEYLDLEMIQMSPTDAAGMPQDFGEQVQIFDNALEILRANREVWDLISLELYQQEGICTDIVRALWLGIMAPSETA